MRTHQWTISRRNLGGVLAGLLIVMTLFASCAANKHPLRVPSTQLAPGVAPTLPVLPRVHRSVNRAHVSSLKHTRRRYTGKIIKRKHGHPRKRILVPRKPHIRTTHPVKVSPPRPKVSTGTHQVVNGKLVHCENGVCTLVASTPILR